jgi:hypothetical protein
MAWVLIACWVAAVALTLGALNGMARRRDLEMEFDEIVEPLQYEFKWDDETL